MTDLLLRWLAFSLGLFLTSGTKHEPNDGMNGTNSNDPSCLLSLPRAQHGGVLQDYDPWQEFMESNAEVAAYNTMRVFTMGVASMTPVIGAIVGLVLTVFWPSKGANEALIEAIMDWTKRFVSQKILNFLQGLIDAKINFVQSELDWYQHDIKPVKDAVERGKTFPADKLIQAVNGPLARAKTKAKEARYDIFAQREYRGRVLQMYVLASSLHLSCVRELYIATVSYEKYTGKSPPWGGAKTVTENMKVAYTEIESELVELSAEWQKWRWGSFLLEDNSYYSKWEEKSCGRFNLKDPFRPQDDKEWGVECYDSRRRSGRYWIDRPKMQDNLRFMHIRNLKIKELVPILTSFAAFSKLIPGQEEMPMKRGKVLPEKIEVGPVSTWINGAYSLRQQDEKRMAYPNLPVPDTVSFNELKACYDTESLDRFAFCKDKWQCNWGYGNCGGYGVKRQAIGDPCGISLSYGGDKMVEWFFLYPDNGTKFWRAKHPEAKFGGAFCSGTGLCGLYKWDGMTKSVEEYHELQDLTTGDGWMMSFKWLWD